MTIMSIRLPDIGEGITQVELIEWNVSVGSLIREDDVLASVMTDKATVEIPSAYEGRVVSLGCDAGEMIAVGSELAKIEITGTGVKDRPSGETHAPEAFEHAPDAIETAANDSAAAKPAPSHNVKDKPQPAHHAAGPVVSSPRNEGETVLASPSVRARARDGGIDLRQVAGSGPAGRITEQDLDGIFAAERPHAPQANTTGERRRGGEEKIRVIGLRRKIAERMALANARIPHITVIEEVDMTSLEDLRNKMNAERGAKPKLTVLPFITAALAKAMIDHPEMNAHYYDEEGHVTRFGAVHLGIATMTDSGLVVPVLRHAEALDLFETAIEIARLAEAARSGKATRDELSGSSFTVTSLGPLGAIATTPIINHPEVAILGVNKMAIRPMWDGQQFVPRTMMNISASFDHRVIDGLDAAKFVNRMKTLLETPAMIFIGR